MYKYMLFAGQEVCVEKNCVLGIEHGPILDFPIWTWGLDGKIPPARTCLGLSYWSLTSQPGVTESTPCSSSQISS